MEPAVPAARLTSTQAVHGNSGRTRNTLTTKLAAVESRRKYQVPKLYRILLVLLALLGILWMALPLVHEQGTEMSFMAGSPDPNVYTRTWEFGSPLTWISWERAWNEAAGYDDTGFRGFGAVSFLIHLIVCVTPMLVLRRLSRHRWAADSETPATASNG